MKNKRNKHLLLYTCDMKKKVQIDYFMGVYKCSFFDNSFVISQTFLKEKYFLLSTVFQFISENDKMHVFQETHMNKLVSVHL